MGTFCGVVPSPSAVASTFRVPGLDSSPGGFLLERVASTSPGESFAPVPTSFTLDIWVMGA